MRKYSVMLLIALVVVALGSMACDSSESALDESLTPEEMLTDALDEMSSADSGSGSYEVEVTLDIDSGQVPADELAMLQMFLGGPITVSGTFAGQDDPVRADVTIALGVSALEIPVGIRAIDEQAWISIMDQWYEAPEDLQQQIDISDEDLVDEMTAIVEDMDIDPASWTTGFTREADETIADTETVHLSGAIDVEQMIDDMFELMQDPKVAEMMSDAVGEAGDLSATEMPSAFQLATVKAILQAMIEDNTMDVWIAKADSSLRRMVMTLDMVFPPEMDMEGLSGISVVVTVDLDAPGTKVEVEAPESAKPFDELEEDMQNNPFLGGFLEGFLGSEMDSDSSLAF